MEKLKRCNHGDLLRELPDCLIFEIFWRLPMTDVVRTSLLSKRWRNFWTTCPFLNFDKSAMLFVDDSKLRNFVNRALLCWNGSRVLNFRFNLRHELASSMFNDVDMWVNFAQRYGVEKLYLHVLWNSTPVRRGLDGKEIYRVPPCLYSCSSLKELTLQSCNLEFCGNVQWNQLKCLKIINIGATADVINQVLSGTPQLKVFHLSYVDKGGNLSIQSTTLKELYIRKYILAREDVLVVSELRICTPNLETLEIEGFSYKKYSLADVSSLKRVVLGLLTFCHFMLTRFSNPLSQILPSIQHAENVTLSDCCTKVVDAMKMKCTCSAFRNVKSLELRCSLDDYKQVVGILEIFPQLERLVIKKMKKDTLKDDTESLKFEAILPRDQSFLLRLRTIEVTWSEGYGIFPLIELLLKYASKLENFVFQIKEIKSPAPSDSLLLVSQKLLRMRRSSSNCTMDLTILS